MLGRPSSRLMIRLLWTGACLVWVGASSRTFLESWFIGITPFFAYPYHAVMQDREFRVDIVADAYRAYVLTLELLSRLALRD